MSEKLETYSLRAEPNRIISTKWNFSPIVGRFMRSLADALILKGMFKMPTHGCHSLMSSACFNFSSVMNTFFNVEDFPRPLKSKQRRIGELQKPPFQTPQANMISTASPPTRVKIPLIRQVGVHQTLNDCQAHNIAGRNFCQSLNIKVC